MRDIRIISADNGSLDGFAQRLRITVSIPSETHDAEVVTDRVHESLVDLRSEFGQSTGDFIVSSGPEGTDPTVEALLLIRNLYGGGCEHSTSGIGACFDNGRTADAHYGADRACAACIAEHALTGRRAPRGAGRHALEVAL